MKLAEKVVVITGGGSGIGRAAAILMAKEGAKVRSNLRNSTRNCLPVNQ
jgi:NAD(P)-dependent dehydrogenase (short-subunit alcohol dehydrogenase family)